MKRVKIVAECISIEAILYDTLTANKMWYVLPIQSGVNTWGDEVYFSIPIQLDQEEGKQVVREGDLGYWPDEHAFCIFFGPKPVSKPGEIHPANPVNVFGKVLDDFQVLKEKSSGEKIIVKSIH
jgi:hypothetical protein